MGKRTLDLKVLRKGKVVAELRAEADPKDIKQLRTLLEDVVRRDGRDRDQIVDYEMQVRLTHDPSRLIDHDVRGDGPLKTRQNSQ